MLSTISKFSSKIFIKCFLFDQSIHLGFRIVSPISQPFYIFTLKIRWGQNAIEININHSFIRVFRTEAVGSQASLRGLRGQIVRRINANNIVSTMAPLTCNHVRCFGWSSIGGRQTGRWHFVPFELSKIVLTWWFQCLVIIKIHFVVYLLCPNKCVVWFQLIFEQ